MWLPTLGFFFGFVAFDRTGCLEIIRAVLWIIAIPIIRYKYSDRPHISTAELRDLIFRSRGELLIIDTRTKEEYSISHLKGAVHIDDFPHVITKRKIDPQSQIVAYSAIGANSAKFAREAVENGYPNVVNYLGSIFEWVNYGFPVVDAQERKTVYIHCSRYIFLPFLRLF